MDDAIFYPKAYHNNSHKVDKNTINSAFQLEHVTNVVVNCVETTQNTIKLNNNVKSAGK